MSADRVTELLDEASENIGDALHIYKSPAFPSGLSSRAGTFVELLGRLREVATRLNDAILEAPSTFNLGSDDDASAGNHISEACARLSESIVDLASAHISADEAHSALSHLKIHDV
jgi:hypothetical protein